MTREGFGGLQESFARRSSFEWLSESGGCILTLQPRMTPDMARVLGVVVKNVRGMFHHVTGRTLPPEVQVTVLAEHQVAKMPREGQRAAHRWLHIARQGAKGSRGEGVFGFTLRVTDDNPNSFAAGVIYFRAFAFIAASVSANLDSRLLAVPPHRL